MLKYIILAIALLAPTAALAEPLDWSLSQCVSYTAPGVLLIGPLTNSECYTTNYAEAEVSEQDAGVDACSVFDALRPTWGLTWAADHQGQGGLACPSGIFYSGAEW